MTGLECPKGQGMSFRVWWDTKLKKMVKKNLNSRIPEKYRCPQCGKILVKLSDRKYWDASFDLGFYGGVCESCWLDGFGNYGKVGKFFNKMISREGNKVNT